jgi:Flp pilus assembly protein CpaB
LVDAPTRRTAGATAAPGAAREVRRRRALPGSRAVVGGFLVAAAAVGTFGAYSAAGDAPGQPYVALTRDVPAGQALSPGDLEIVRADLSARQRQVVVTDLLVAEGAVAVSPLQAGQLLATGDVVKLAGVEGRAQLSIPVEPARANNGELTPGERVDVISTSSDAGSSTTETIARDATVVRVFRGEQSLGSSSNVVVTLSLTAGELEPVAAAAAGDVIALARVSGLERAEGEVAGGG